MALRIRCPHCREAVTVDDELAGKLTPCPSCQQPLQVPIPIVKSVHRTIETACPRCKHALAPGTMVCPKCLTDTTTGKRLPLFKRVALRPVQATMTGLASTVVILGAAYVGWWAWPLLKNEPPVARPVSTAPTVKDIASNEAETWSRRLFAAQTPAERHESQQELERLGNAAVAPLAEQLFEALKHPNANPAAEKVAVELLGASGDSHWLPVLRDATKVGALRAEAQRARALLGDVEVLADLIARWQEHLQTQVFLERMQELLQQGGEPFEAAAVELESRVTQQCVDGLRALVSKSPQVVFDKVLAP